MAADAPDDVTDDVGDDVDVDGGEVSRPPAAVNQTQNNVTVPALYDNDVDDHVSRPVWPVSRGHPSYERHDQHTVNIIASRLSVRLSVTSVDCYHSVHQKVELST